MSSMKAHEYAPIVALEAEPLGALTELKQREEALRDALRGVELGRYDEKIIGWMLKRLDNSTLRVVVSWRERVRGVGMTDALDVEVALQKRRRNAGRFPW